MSPKLLRAAANVGGIDEILTWRPGSWETVTICDALFATVGDDPAELLRHRSAPVQVQIHARDLLEELVNDFVREIAALGERLAQCRRATELPDDPRNPWVQYNAEWDRLRQNNPAQHARRFTAMFPEQGCQIIEEYQQKVDRIIAQVAADLHGYAENLDATIRAHLRVLDLPVPVIIDILDRDDPPPATDLCMSVQDASTPIDRAIAATIDETTRPSTRDDSLAHRADIADRLAAISPNDCYAR